MRMQSGKYIPSSMPYGYQLNEKEIEIFPEQAQIIRGIYSDYLAGQSMQSIADKLNRDGVPLRTTSKTQLWRISTIEYILSNERYVGDSLWQKTYQTTDLSHKSKRNKGELEQYFLTSTHPAIIDRDTFQKVQALRAMRAVSAKSRSCDAIRHRLRCGVCNGPYRSVQGK